MIRNGRAGSSPASGTTKSTHPLNCSGVQGVFYFEMYTVNKCIAIICDTRDKKISAEFESYIN